MTNAARTDISRVVSLSEVSKRPMKPKPMTEVMTIVTPFDADADAAEYKWSEIRDRLELGSNVANARWMPEKLMPLFADLDAPALLTVKGKPTKFCAQMIARYKAACVDANDYDGFCQQVRSAFAGDAAKPVHVEVLTNDDASDGNSDKPSALTVMRQQIEDRDDSLESRILLAVQTKRQAIEASNQYQKLHSKAWEQEVIDDELAKYQEEQERKKREFDLRAKVRQMLDSQD